MVKKGFRLTRQTKNKLENIKKLLISRSLEDAKVGVELLGGLPMKQFLFILKPYKRYDNNCTYEIFIPERKWSAGDVYSTQIKGNYVVSFPYHSIYIDHRSRVKSRSQTDRPQFSDELQHLKEKWKI